MNACMSEFRIVNPTLRTFSAAEARIAHSSIRFNNLSAAELGYPEHIRLLISSVAARWPFRPVTEGQVRRALYGRSHCR